MFCSVLAIWPIIWPCWFGPVDRQYLLEEAHSWPPHDLRATEVNHIPEHLGEKSRKEKEKQTREKKKHANITNPGVLNARAISLKAAAVHSGALTYGSRRWLTLRVLRSCTPAADIFQVLDIDHRWMLLAFPLHIQKSKLADLKDIQKKLVRFLLGKRGVLLCWGRIFCSPG